MSDNLVKLAREWNFCWPSHDVEMLVPAMADHIEELESKLDDKEAECRYLRGQVGLLTAKLERDVFLTDADIARIHEICENPPPITEHMLAAIGRALIQTGEK